MSDNRTATILVQRSGQPVTVNIEATVYGDVVAISRATADDKFIRLDDNETSAARCQILDTIYPKSGWDIRVKKLLAIALKYPGF